MAESGSTSPFADFTATLPPAGDLSSDLVGKDATIEGPFGARALVYADYVASGRALHSIESFVLERVLPYYANSHTEASFCGAYMTRLRDEARAIVARHCGADDRYATIFAGSGATAGLNRLVSLFGAGSGRVKVIIGPYEHHSNILPWRESGADVIQLPEGLGGGPDLNTLDAALADASDFDRVICAFSAASNVSGIVADVPGLTMRVKAAGAMMVWDYAGGGPYLPISVAGAASAEIDAIVLSPHKFIGGPGASGILVVRRDAVVSQRPTWAGGGTVRFVSSDAHDYAGDLEHREEAGTPNVVGDIRAALAVLVKERIGIEAITRRNADLAARAIAAWKDAPSLELLGLTQPERLPILSFRVRDEEGGYVHQQLATKLLSDCFGIQARGGCACAGPYVLQLLGFNRDETTSVRNEILAGNELSKPGFVRLNLSVLLSDAEVDYMLESVKTLSAVARDCASRYRIDETRAIFHAA